MDRGKRQPFRFRPRKEEKEKKKRAATPVTGGGGRGKRKPNLTKGEKKSTLHRHERREEEGKPGTAVSTWGGRKERKKQDTGERKHKLSLIFTGEKKKGKRHGDHYYDLRVGQKKEVNPAGGEEEGQLLLFNFLMGPQGKKEEKEGKPVYADTVSPREERRKVQA